MRRWWYSLVLAVGYVSVFVLWATTPGSDLRKTTGTVAALALAILLVKAWRKGYFLTRADVYAHGIIVADIALEAWLIEAHGGYGFWKCAAAFFIVLGAYRWHVLKYRRPAGTQTETDGTAADHGESG